MAGALWSCAGALFVRAGATGTETFAAVCGAGNDGQRQTHSRESRYRYPVGGAAFLLSCGVGSAFGAGVSGVHSLRRGGADHSLELSTADVGMEDRAGFGRWKYCWVAACGIYTD